MHYKHNIVRNTFLSIFRSRSSFALDVSHYSFNTTFCIFYYTQLQTQSFFKHHIISKHIQSTELRIFNLFTVTSGLAPPDKTQ